MEIKCKFKSITWHNKIVYTCLVKSAEITERNTRIAAFIGNHLPGKMNEDVEGICFQNTKLEYFLRGLVKIFPNLKTISIYNCGLKELTNLDLIGLEGLIELWLLGNQLESLPSNLLNNMKNLTRVSFALNKLKFVDSRMFDHIKDQLVELDLSNNPSINKFYDQGKRAKKGAMQTINELLKTIDEECDKPKVDPENHFYFKQLWSSKRFSDFTVIADNKGFKVHKNVLGIQSPVFAAMFENDMEESKSGKVTINDFSADAVEGFLHFLYTGEVADEKNAMEVFALASKYDVKDLKREMEEIIAMNIESENAIEILKLGNLYDSEVLKTEALVKVKLANLELNLPDHMKNKPENIEKLIEAKRHHDQEVATSSAKFKRTEQFLLEQ